MAVLGLLVFAFMVWRIGPGVIWSELRRISLWSFVLLFGMRAGHWLFRTWIWRIVYARYDDPPSYGHLFAARLAGHAASYLTPIAYVGGEAVRTLMIEGRDRTKALASIIVNTTFEVLAVGFLSALGIGAMLSRSALPFPARATLAGSFAAAALIMVYLVRKQRSGFFGWLAGIPARLGLHPRFIERNRDRIQTVDAHIAEFYARGSGGPVKVFALDTLLNILWMLEIFVTLRALGAPALTIGKSVLVAAFNAASMGLPASPAALGTYEAMNLAVFAALGWTAGLAMSMAIIRRILSLFWAGVGLLFIARNHVRLGPAAEKPVDVQGNLGSAPGPGAMDRSE